MSEVAKEGNATSSSTVDHVIGFLIITVGHSSIDMGSYELKLSWAYVFVLLF